MGVSNDGVLAGPLCGAIATCASAGPATLEIPRNAEAETHAERVTVTCLLSGTKSVQICTQQERLKGALCFGTRFINERAQ